MTRTELFIVAYAMLAIASIAWAVRLIVRTSTVRQAVETLPVALLPGWAVALLVAYRAGGSGLAVQMAAAGVLALGTLWLLRHGVDHDSGMLETVEHGVDDTRLTSASS